MLYDRADGVDDKLSRKIKCRRDLGASGRFRISLLLDDVIAVKPKLDAGLRSQDVIQT